MEKKWEKRERNGYTLIVNQDGKNLGLAADSKVNILTIDGYAFKDFLGSGELVPYEDWRLPYEERAKDLADRISIEDIAGLMLYSATRLYRLKDRWQPYSVEVMEESLLRKVMLRPGT